MIELTRPWSDYKRAGPMGQVAPITTVTPDTRPSAARRGYGHDHRKWRELILSRHPVCVQCDMAASEHADHVVPLSQGGESTMENGQGLCPGCHNVKTKREGGRPAGPTRRNTTW